MGFDLTEDKSESAFWGKLAAQREPEPPDTFWENLAAKQERKPLETAAPSPPARYELASPGAIYEGIIKPGVEVIGRYPLQAAGALAAHVRTPEEVGDKASFLTRIIDKAAEDQKEFEQKYKDTTNITIPLTKVLPEGWGADIDTKTILRLPQQAAFSTVGMGAGLAAGALATAAAAPTGPAAPAVGYAAGMAANFGSMYAMQKDMATQKVYEKLNEASIKNTGNPLTPEEWKAAYRENKGGLIEQGISEALPETIGNLGLFELFLGGAQRALGKKIATTVVGNILQKSGAVFAGKALAAQAVEQVTETWTQQWQHNLDIEMGLAPGETRRSWTSLDDLRKSNQEVFADIFLLTVLTGVGGHFGGKYQERQAGKRNAQLVKDVVAENKFSSIPNEFLPAIYTYSDELTKERPSDKELVVARDAFGKEMDRRGIDYDMTSKLTEYLKLDSAIKSDDATGNDIARWVSLRDEFKEKNISPDLFQQYLSYQSDVTRASALQRRNLAGKGTEGDRKEFESLVDSIVKRGTIFGFPEDVLDVSGVGRGGVVSKPVEVVKSGARDVLLGDATPDKKNAATAKDVLTGGLDIQSEEDLESPEAQAGIDKILGGGGIVGGARAPAGEKPPKVLDITEAAKADEQALFAQWDADTNTAGGPAFIRDKVKKLFAEGGEPAVLGLYSADDASSRYAKYQLERLKTAAPEAGAAPARTLYRGVGREEAGEVYGEMTDKKPILEGGEFWTLSEKDAKRYGPTVESQPMPEFTNPLTITNDVQWNQIVRTALSQYDTPQERVSYPNPAGLSPEKMAKWRKGMSDYLAANNYDAMIIDMEGARGDEAKSLERAFSHSQVFIPGTKAEEATGVAAWMPGEDEAGRYYSTGAEDFYIRPNAKETEFTIESEEGPVGAPLGSLDDAVAAVDKLRTGEGGAENGQVQQTETEVTEAPVIEAAGEAVAEAAAPVVGGARTPGVEAIDQAAHEAATSPTNEIPEPTEGQKKAGNYKMGHVNLEGLDISIENPAGSVRKGVDEDGKPWETPIAYHYGYIKKTEGKDGDHVDTFLGPNPDAGKVFIVDQQDPKTQKFDEHKTLIGFDNLEEARAGYLANYDETGPTRIMGITEMPMAEFKEWLKGDTTKRVSKAAPEYKGNLSGIEPYASPHSDSMKWENKADRIEYELNAPNIASNPTPYYEAGIRHKGWAQEAQRFNTREEAIAWLEGYDTSKINKEGWGPGEQFFREMFGDNFDEEVQDKITPDNEAVVKAAIADAKKNGPSPEFRALFGGIAPDIAGTTLEKVTALADELGLVYRAEAVAAPETIPYSKDLKITNLDALPRGTGARYLEVIRGEGDVLVAKQWRRKPVEGAILVDMEPTAPGKAEEVPAAEAKPLNQLVGDFVDKRSAEYNAIIERLKTEGRTAEIPYFNQQAAALLKMDKMRHYNEAALTGPDGLATLPKWLQDEFAAYQANPPAAPAPTTTPALSPIEAELAAMPDNFDFLDEAPAVKTGGARAPVAGGRKGGAPGAAGIIPVAPAAPRGAADAAQALEIATKHGLEGAADAFKGLYALFGGGALKTFPGTIDKETYEKAKPYFETAYQHAIDLGKSVKEFYDIVVEMIGEAIKPYVKHFLSVKRAEILGEEEPAFPGEEAAAPTEGTAPEWEEITSPLPQKFTAELVIGSNNTFNIQPPSGTGFTYEAQAQIRAWAEERGYQVDENLRGFLISNPDQDSIEVPVPGEETAGPVSLDEPKPAAGEGAAVVGGARRPRGKKLQDTGVMAGKISQKNHAERVQWINVSLDNQLAGEPKAIVKAILNMTTKADIFKINETLVGRTPGLTRWLKEFRSSLKGFLEYAGKQYGGGRGRWRTSFQDALIREIGTPEGQATVRLQAANYIAMLQTIQEATSDSLNITQAVQNIYAKILDDPSVNTPFMFEQSRKPEEMLSEFGKALANASGRDHLISYRSLKEQLGPIALQMMQAESDETRNLPIVRRRIKLEDIVTSDEYRHGANITGLDLKVAFGLQDVEYGEWAEATHRQLSTNLAYDSFFDLAKILECPVQGIAAPFAAGTRLGMAFASRGRGKAAAHYEPDNDVVNLTKTHGDGSLAHELMHRLHHKLKIMHPNQRGTGVNVFEDTINTLITEYRLENLEQKVEDILRGLDPDIRRWSPTGNRLEDARKYLTEDIEATFKFDTKFYRDAIKLDGGVRDKYWSKRTELLSRAFEGFTADELQGENRYLVDVDFVSPGAVEGMFNRDHAAYPTEQERVAFNLIFSRLWEGMVWAEDGTVSMKPDFVLVSEQRQADVDAAIQRVLEKLEAWYNLIYKGEQSEDGLYWYAYEVAERGSMMQPTGFGAYDDAYRLPVPEPTEGEEAVEITGKGAVGYLEQLKADDVVKYRFVPIVHEKTDTTIPVKEEENGLSGHEDQDTMEGGTSAHGGAAGGAGGLVGGGGLGGGTSDTGNVMVDAEGNPVVAGGGAGAGPVVLPHGAGAGGAIAGSDALLADPIDFVIHSVDSPATASKAVAFTKNLAAIRTLKKIEAENRRATAEEQIILFQFQGWGNLVEAVDRSPKEAWVDRAEMLRQALTVDELSEARGNILTGYYTPLGVYDSIYRALSKFGFSEGRILCPAIGIGHEIGLMPDQMRRNSRITAIEMDSISSRIAQQLYQSIQVTTSSFEDVAMPEEFFDLAIANVPFGDGTPYDSKHNPDRFKIHDYFINKMLAGVREGGLLIAITTSGTLDNWRSKDARELWAKKADLVGALRLPNGTFKDQGTPIMTDILIFRKRFPTDKPNEVKFSELKDVTFPKKEGAYSGDLTQQINEYFVDHPEMAIGTLDINRDRWGNWVVVNSGPNEGAALTDAIDAAIQTLEDGIYHKTITHMQSDIADRIPSPDFAKDGGLFLSGKNIMLNTGGTSTAWEPKIVKSGKNRDVPKGMKPAVYIEHVKRMVRAYIGLRGTVRLLLKAQYKNDPDVEKIRQKLNDDYWKFVGTVDEKTGKRLTGFGRLGDRDNLKHILTDIDGGQIAALEIWRFPEGSGKVVSEVETELEAELLGDVLPEEIPEEEKETPEPIFDSLQEIFYKNTAKITEPPTSADNASDALLHSLMWKGKIDLAYMEYLTGTPRAVLIEQLKGLIYDEPGKWWVTADEYLSGDVKDKLKKAQEAAAIDPAYAENVRQLQAIVPVDLQPHQIPAQLGAPWIPSEYISQFANELMRRGEQIEVQYIPLANTWTIDITGHTENAAKDNKRHIDASVAATSTWGTRRMGFLKLLDYALNGGMPRVMGGLGNPDPVTGIRTDYTIHGVTRKDDVHLFNPDETDAAYAKLEEIRIKFETWAWSSRGRSNTLATRYNDLHNQIVDRTFDGSHLLLPGKVPDEIIKLLPHQINAVWRYLTTGKAYFGHEVGVGKTFAMVAAIMESRRLGLANKPVFAVKGPTIDQIRSDFYRLYPGANILTVDITKESRVEDMRRIATGNYDAIIMSHEALERIPVSPETEINFIRRETEKLERALTAIAHSRAAKWRKKSSERELQKKLKALREKIRKLQQEVVREPGISTFEEMGIDMLVIDEAHAFKNLDIDTNYKGVKGLHSKESMRAGDIFMKTQYLLEKNKRGLIFATGTPLSNSIGELFAIQQHFQADELSRVGIDGFDQWVATFGVVGQQAEPSPEGGGYQQVTRFLRFRGIPELMAKVRKFMDLITADEIGIPRPTIANPGSKPELIRVPQSRWHQRHQNSLMFRADNIRRHPGHIEDKPAGLPKSHKHEWTDTGHAGQQELTCSTCGARWVGANYRGVPDLMLRILHDGRDAALDPRIIDPSLPDNPLTKTNYLIKEVFALYQASHEAEDPYTGDTYTEDKGVQLIFSDRGVPGTGRFSVYDDIKNKLVAMGIPAHEIAFIQEATLAKGGPREKELAKRRLLEKAREGKIRILIGGTQNLGTGTNVQDRVVAVHNLDADWNAANQTQRIGRAIRRGNRIRSVYINNYGVNKGVDAFMWSTVGQKQYVLSQILSKNPLIRDSEDISVDDLTAKEFSAMLADNPLVLEKFTIDTEVRKLRSQRGVFDLTKREQRAELQGIPPHIERLQEEMKPFARGLEIIQQATAIKIGDEFYDLEKDGGKVNKLAADVFPEAFMKEYFADVEKLKADREALRVKYSAIKNRTMKDSAQWNTEDEALYTQFAQKYKITSRPIAGWGALALDMRPFGRLGYITEEKMVVKADKPDLPSAFTAAATDKDNVISLLSPADKPFSAEDKTLVKSWAKKHGYKLTEGATGYSVMGAEGAKIELPVPGTIPDVETVIRKFVPIEADARISAANMPGPSGKWVSGGEHTNRFVFRASDATTSTDQDVSAGFNRALTAFKNKHTTALEYRAKDIDELNAKTVALEEDIAKEFPKLKELQEKTSRQQELAELLVEVQRQNEERRRAEAALFAREEAERERSGIIIAEGTLPPLPASFRAFKSPTGNAFSIYPAEGTTFTDEEKEQIQAWADAQVFDATPDGEGFRIAKVGVAPIEIPAPETETPLGERPIEAIELKPGEGIMLDLKPGEGILFTATEEKPVVAPELGEKVQKALNALRVIATQKWGGERWDGDREAQNAGQDVLDELADMDQPEKAKYARERIDLLTFSEFYDATRQEEYDTSEDEAEDEKALREEYDRLIYDGEDSPIDYFTWSANQTKAMAAIAQYEGDREEGAAAAQRRLNEIKDAWVEENGDDPRSPEFEDAIQSAQRVITTVRTGQLLLFPEQYLYSSTPDMTPGVTLADVQAIFKGQEVIQPGGGNSSIYIKTRGGRYLTIEKVNFISPDEVEFEMTHGEKFDPETMTITGSYGKGNIRLHRDKAGKWTMIHEVEHFLEDSGIINAEDVAVLRAHIQRQVKQGKRETANAKDIGGSEDRANFLADALTKEPPGGLVGLVVARIQKFLDRLMAAFGVRTAGMIVRDVESGKIYERKDAEEMLRDAGIDKKIIAAIPQGTVIKKSLTPPAGSLLQRLTSMAVVMGRADSENKTIWLNKIGLAIYDTQFAAAIAKMLKQPVSSKYVLAHEAAHAATMHVINEALEMPGSEIHATIEKLDKAIEPFIGSVNRILAELGNKYGTLDEYEFVAEYLVNPYFKEWVLRKSSKETIATIDGLIDDVLAYGSEKGRAAPAGTDRYMVSAWHGGRKLKGGRFSRQAIGSAHGLSAGHGFYFSDLEGVGRHYAESARGVNADTEFWESFLDVAPKELVREFRNEIEAAASRSVPSDQMGIELANVRWLRENGKPQNYISEELADRVLPLIPEKVSRNLYRVSIHKGKGPGEYTWLDWDKPVSAKNLDNIKMSIAANYSDDNPYFAPLRDLANRMTPQYGWEKGVSSLTGREAYWEIAKILGSAKDASDFLMNAGIDGNRVPVGYFGGKQTEGAYNYVVFDPNAITIEEHVQYAASKRGNLAIVHNLSIANLRHAIKVGGLAAPSTAVIDVAKSTFDRFGEITLIASAERLGPGVSKKNRYFNADAYSPRYPQVTYFLTEKSRKALHGYLEPIWKEVPKSEVKHGGAGIASSYVIEEDIKQKGLEAVFAQNEPLLHYAYLKEIGQLPEGIDTSWEGKTKLREAVEGIGRDKYEAWGIEKIKELGLKADEKIYNGTTALGNRRYLAHNLDTVVRLLTKELKDGEGFNYGVPSIRAANAMQFRTLKQMKENRDKIVSAEDMKRLKEETDAEFMQLADQALPLMKHRRGFGDLDTFSDHIKDAIKTHNFDREFGEKSEYFNPGVDVKGIVDFVNKLRNMPTGYFEGKIQRAVGLTEFERAVVPDDTPQDLVDWLTSRGLKVDTYKKNDTEDRRTKIRGSATEGGLLYAVEKAATRTWQITFNLSGENHVYHRPAVSEAQALNLAQRAMAKDMEISLAKVRSLNYEIVEVKAPLKQPGKGAWEGMLYRGKGEKPSDPGDFGVGEYHSSVEARAKQYGIVQKVKVSLKNPLRLTEEEAYQLADDKYGTIRGDRPIGSGRGKTEARQKAAETMTADLMSQGYDGIIVTNKAGELEVVKFPKQLPIEEKVETESQEGRIPFTKEFYKTRQEVGQDFEDAFSKTDYPALPMLGSDWGMGAPRGALDTPGGFYNFAVQRLRQKYPMKPDELTDVRRRAPIAGKGGVEVQKGDAAYLKAVESGDMEAAKKMVDEAAKRAGYNVGPVWHGSETKDIKIFAGDRGVGWFTDDRKHATVYARTDREGGKISGKVYAAYIKMEDPFLLRSDANDVMTLDQFEDEIGFSLTKNTLKGRLTTYSVWEMTDPNYTSFLSDIEDKGYDAVAVMDTFKGRNAETFLPLNPSQIKSADPVTYDDKGNVIPLSERFKEETPDIRYAAGEKAGTVKIGLQTIQNAFKGQSIVPEGENFTLTLKNGLKVQIMGVAEITPDSVQLKLGYGEAGKGKRIVGAFAVDEQGNYIIRVVRDSEDAPWTLAHESTHLLVKLGIISKADQATINAVAQKEGKWDDNLSAEENQANWLADFVIAPQPKKTVLAEIWQKIKDFINGIAGIRTAEMIGREFQTGKIFDRATTTESARQAVYDLFHPEQYAAVADTIDSASLFPEVEERLRAAKGIKRATLKEKAKDALITGWDHFSRHFQDLDPATDGAIIDVCRTFQDVPVWAKSETVRRLSEFVGKLTPKGRDVFSMNILLQDMLQDIDNGTLTVDDEGGLPFGYKARAQVQQDLDHYKAVAETNREIIEALRQRNEFMTSLTNQLVENKLLKKDSAKDPAAYFHHQVLYYLNYRQNQTWGMSSQDVRAHRKGWQLARKGSALDYNTEYIEAEFEVISQALTQIETVKTLKEIDRLANIKPQLEAEAKDQNMSVFARKTAEMGEEDPLKPFRSKIAIGFRKLTKLINDGDLYVPEEFTEVVEHIIEQDEERKAAEEEERAFDPAPHPLMFPFLNYLINHQDSGGAMPAAMIFKAIAGRNAYMKQVVGKDWVTYRNLIPAGFVIHKPEAKSTFYFTNSIADQAIDAVLAGNKALPDAVRKVLARGRDEEWVVKEGVSKTLNEFRPAKTDSLPAKASKGLLTTWKQWILMNPFRVIKYNLNNMSGDMDIVMAYDPKIITGYFMQATKDLWAASRGKASQALLDELSDLTKRGVVGSGMTQMDIPELDSIESVKTLVDFFDGKSKNALSRWYAYSKKLSTLRENILRLAANRYFLERLNRGEYINPGASRKEEVDQVRKELGIEATAAKLARELVGDYGNISHAGQYLRERVIPFYSWLEINAPRYVRMFRNLKHEGGEGIGAFGGVMAWKATKLAIKASALMGLVILWNAAMFPDEEEELQETGREQLHLILGRRADGTIITLRFQGALSDALSWFGMSNPFEVAKSMARGTRSVKDVAKDMAWATPKRLFQGIRPEAKLGFEVLTGQTLYPDPVHPRPIRDTTEHILRTFSLDKIWNRVAGKPKQGGSWETQIVRDVIGMIAYEADPGEQAYYTTRKYIFDWLEAQGKEKPVAMPTNRSNALYYYKQALKFGDMEAAAKYLKKYQDMGGKMHDIQGSIKRVHPLSTLKLSDRYKFRESLTPEQRQTLETATLWYKEHYMSAYREQRRLPQAGSAQ